MGSNTAARFLGKSTEYKSEYDKDLLVPIDRAERREGYDHKMYGGDVWTAFEVSFLLSSGLPYFTVMRFMNPADSNFIFESKSLKLYLNSFNNTVFESVDEAVKTIERDLSELAGAAVDVREITEFEDAHTFYSPAKCLEDSVDPDDIEFKYEYDNSLLKLTDIANESDRYQLVYSDLLRSNCEITNQPDWGRVFIGYTSTDGKILTHESLLQYIVSYRTHQEFHEPTCERIYQDLANALDFGSLQVICQYTRRGGIDINPIRSSEKVLDRFFDLPKLIQQ